MKQLTDMKHDFRFCFDEERRSGFNEGADQALNIVKLLDEPEKPIVPQYVADWYEDNEDGFEFNLYTLCLDYNNCEVDKKLSDWFCDKHNKPIETLVMMHKFGYNVEKKKLYTARFKASNEYLNLDKDYKELLHFRVPKNVSERCNNYHFTKEKLIEYSVWENDAYEVEEVKE